MWAQGAQNIQIKRNGNQKNIKSQFQNKNNVELPFPHRWETLKSVTWKHSESFNFRGLTLDCPNTVFGNSKHPSTKIALKMLDSNLIDKVGNHYQFADIGTGSGILAFAAWNHGVTNIQAIDNSPKAIQIAQKNAHQNKIPDTIFQLNSIGSWTPGIKFHFIVANIPIDVLEMTFSKICQLLDGNGILVVTGLTTKWENVLLDMIENENLEVIQRIKENDWVGFSLKQIKG